MATLPALTSLSPALIAIIYYAMMSLVTFALYARDKHAARCGAHRVRERTLQAWTMLGGFAGALAGQLLLRHKSRRAAFVVAAWFALAMHAAAWTWWLAG